MFVIVLSTGVMSNTVKAASCPPHGPYSNYNSTVGQWTSTHKVYHNSFVGSEQVYSICSVSNEVVRFSTYCNTCNTTIGYEDKVYETHSLASDKDH